MGWTLFLVIGLLLPLKSAFSDLALIPMAPGSSHSIIGEICDSHSHRTSPSHQVCVQYARRLLSREGRVETVRETLYVDAHFVTPYSGDNYFPLPMASIDFFIEGEFGELTEVLPLHSFDDSSFLCIATKDLRILREGYTQEIRYLVVPIPLLRIHHGGRIAPTDRSDRLVRSYFIADASPQTPLTDLNEVVTPPLLPANPLPRFGEFKRRFNRALSAVPDAPVRSFVPNCLRWLLGG